MTINMFEGARRIAKLIAVFIVVGFGIAIFTDSAKPVRLKYAVTAPNQPPVLTETCPDDSVTKNAENHGNDRAEIYLCFLLSYFDLGEILYGRRPGTEKKPWQYFEGNSTPRSLIPYGFDPSTKNLLGDEKGSVEVSTYINQTTKNFRMPPADESHINGLWWSQTLENAGLYFLGMLASLAGWWAFTWTVGWIVRGFMGIPRGADNQLPDEFL